MELIEFEFHLRKDVPNSPIDNTPASIMVMA